MINELFKRILSSLILIPLSIFCIIEGDIFFKIFLTVSFLISIYEWNYMTKNHKYLIFGLVFLCISFFSIYEIRKFDEANPSYILIILLICIFTDIGGYVFGKVLKGPKLTKLSPNKTYTGVIGAYLFPIIFLYLINQFNIDMLSTSYKLNFLFILIISSVSQLGDILISYFKRLSNLKDTGNIIPGHGGILDRIDGMIFAFPASYLIYVIYLK